MFKATVVASDLRSKMAHFFDMVRGNEVVQILHRGAPIKVLMTQEHYLNLLSRLALYERDASEKTVPAKSAAELLASVAEKLKASERDELEEHDSSKFRKARAR